MAHDRDDEDALPEYREVLNDSGLQPVSASEIRKAIGDDREGWKLAMEAELASFTERQVFTKLTPSEAAKVKGYQLLPMKIVAGSKPPKPGETQRRRKVRGVVCGNFAPHNEKEDLYAANVDATTVRTCVALAAVHKWSLRAMDVATAFLHAPLPALSLIHI